MKRFYKKVGTRNVGGHFGVTLDERPVKTPGGELLVVRAAALADAIAAEWAGQGEEVDQRTMPLTGLANTAIDHVRSGRDGVIARLQDFARHDLVCYRSKEPPELVARESAAWDLPLLLASARYGLDLKITDGVGSIPQPAASLDNLRRHLSGRDEFALTGFAAAAGLMKSVVLALALSDGRLSAAEAHDAAHVDATFQAEKWGRDAEAEARLGNLLAELEAAERFMTLAKNPGA